MYVLIALGVIVFIMSFSGSYDAMLFYMYILFGLGVLAAVASAFFTAAVKPENLKQTGIGIGAMLLVVIISYAMADDSVPAKYADTVSASASKWSGAGLYAFYILFIGAIASIVITRVLSIVKK